jgi:hypothetical protein
MNNCCGNPGCGRPFGLIRWSWRFEQFCSVRCRDSCKRQSERNKAYWRWLYKSPDSSRAADQNIIRCCSSPTLDN